MDRLAAMQTFVRVAEAGSFTAVADQMNVARSAVTRQIAALESHLGVKLMARSTASSSIFLNAVVTPRCGSIHGPLTRPWPIAMPSCLLRWRLLLRLLGSLTSFPRGFSRKRILARLRQRQKLPRTHPFPKWYAFRSVRLRPSVRIPMCLQSVHSMAAVAHRIPAECLSRSSRAASELR